MATTATRKVSPSICLRPASDKFCPTPKSGIPRRTSQLYNASASENEPPLKVRFVDDPIPQVIITPTEALQVQSLDGKASLKPLPPKHLSKDEADAPDTSSKPLSTGSYSKAGGISIQPVVDPFIVALSEDEVPELCEDEDPFADAASTSSYSTGPSSILEISTPVPEVHIVDPDASEPGRAETPPADIDLKEQQSYFLKIDQFYHPDVARQQFQERSGHLWTGAIKMLMEHYLHPADLTEHEFVSLVLSQGNASSQWLQTNARMISSRGIRQRMKLHRRLTAAGLPANRLTDEVLELFDIMDESERKAFMAYVEGVSSKVRETENELDLGGVMKEKFEGMSLPEKLEFIARYTASADEPSGSDLGQLQVLQMELAQIESLVALQHCSSVESTESLPSDLPAISRQGSHLSQTREIKNIFEPWEESTSRKTKLLNLAGFGTRFGSTKAGNKLLSHDDIDDAGIEIKSITKTGQHTLGDTIKGRLVRVKSMVFKNIQHPAPAPREEKCQANDSNGHTQCAKGGGQGSIAETLSTATRAVKASPTIVRIKSLSSFSDHKICHQAGTLRFSEDSAVGLQSIFTSDADKDTTCTRSEAHSTDFGLDGQGRYPTDSMSYLAKDHTDGHESDFKQEQSLVKKASRWTLRPRRSQKSIDTSLETLASADKSNSLGFANKVKSKRTLRQKISLFFGPREDCDTPSTSGTRRLSLRRKSFGRRALPEWEFSK